MSPQRHLTMDDFEHLRPYSRQKSFYLEDVFEDIPVSLLALDQPQIGCASRSQILTDWLHASGFVTGQLWAVPQDKKHQIHIYVQGVHLAWDYHVAATVQTKNGQVVFDPVLFDGPVYAQTWQETLSLHTPGNLIFWHQSRNNMVTPEAFKHLVQEDLQEEFQLSPRDLAAGKLISLSRLPKSPVVHRPLRTRIKPPNDLLVRRAF